MNVWLGGMITALPLLLIAAHFAYETHETFSFLKVAFIIFIISTFLFNKSRAQYHKKRKKNSFTAHSFYSVCIIIYGLAWLPVLGIILIRLSGIDYLSS